MNIQEKRKAFEKLLASAPEVMTPMQVAKWTPYGRNTVYACGGRGGACSSRFGERGIRFQRRFARSALDRRGWRPRQPVLLCCLCFY